MSNDQDDSGVAGQMRPTIRRGALGEITIYEVTEDELSAIERGSPDSLLLNFGLFLFSTFLTLAVTLLTVDIVDGRTYYTFLIVCVLSSISCVALVGVWAFLYKDKGEIFRRIRSRLKGGRNDSAEDSGA